MNPLSLSAQESEKFILADAFAPVTAELMEIGPFILDYLGERTRAETTREILHYFFSEPGKMVRPALYLLATRLFKHEFESKISVGAIVELIHAASLIHDDLVDNSTLRRSKRTVHSVWGAASSVLVGDLVYSAASELMAATRSLEIVAMFASAVREMSEAELIQLDFSLESRDVKKTYFAILHGKTSVLIAAACKAAAILGGASEAEKDALWNFGYHTGMAFQLLDDTLDFSALANPLPFGKKPYADFYEGKLTYPLIHLLEVGPSQVSAEVRALLSKDFRTEDDARRVKEWLGEHDSLGATRKVALAHTELAKSALKNGFKPSEARESLERLALFLLARVG